MKSPYFYILKHKISEKYYAGCKINKFADSLFLMKDGGYATSSKVIRKIVKEEGLHAFDIVKIKHFVTAQEALRYEARFLEKVKASTNTRFLNLSEGNAQFVNKGGYSLSDATRRKMSKPKSPETIQKQNIEKSTRSKEIYKKSMDSRRANNPYWNSPETCEKLRIINDLRWADDENRKTHSRIMQEYYKNNPISEVARKRMSEAQSKENNAMFGKIHKDSTKEKMKLAWIKRKQNLQNL